MVSLPALSASVGGYCSPFHLLPLTFLVLAVLLLLLRFLPQISQRNLTVFCFCRRAIRLSRRQGINQILLGYLRALLRRRWRLPLGEQPEGLAQRRAFKPLFG